MPLEACFHALGRRQCAGAIADCGLRLRDRLKGRCTGLTIAGCRDRCESSRDGCTRGFGIAGRACVCAIPPSADARALPSGNVRARARPRTWSSRLSTRRPPCAGTRRSGQAPRPDSHGHRRRPPPARRSSGSTGRPAANSPRPRNRRTGLSRGRRRDVPGSFRGSRFRTGRPGRMPGSSAGRVAAREHTCSFHHDPSSVCRRSPASRASRINPTRPEPSRSRRPLPPWHRSASHRISPGGPATGPPPASRSRSPERQGADARSQFPALPCSAASPPHSAHPRRSRPPRECRR